MNSEFGNEQCSDAGGWCKENGPYAHLLWILVFDDQHNQIRLINLQVIINLIHFYIYLNK